jgi:hypothetical protein
VSAVPEHLFGVDKTPSLDVLLRGKECPMKGGTIIRIEPVTRIERQELNFNSLRELRRLFYHEPAIVNTGLDSHA